MRALWWEIKEAYIFEALRCCSKRSWELGRDGAQWGQTATPSSLIDTLSNSGIDCLPVHTEVVIVIDGGDGSAKVDLIHCCDGHFVVVVEVSGFE